MMMMMTSSALRVAFLLLLVTGTVTARGLFDIFRSNGVSPKPTAARPSAGGDGGFNLADAVNKDPKTAKPAGRNAGGFRLEDALRPAQKPTADPRGGNCQGNLVEKLNAVIENQNQQLRMLRQMIPTSRFYQPRTR